MLKKRKAFTFVEILVVIGIIGILVAITVVGLTKYRQKAYDTRMKTDISNITTALYSYRADHKFKFPFSNNTSPYRWEWLVNNLEYSTTSAALINGGYLTSMPVNSVTGKPFYYWSDGKTFMLRGMEIAQPTYYYEAYVENGEIKYHEVQTQSNASPFWRDKSFWVSHVSSPDVSNNINVTLSWRQAYGVNQPIRYNVYYKEWTADDSTTPWTGKVTDIYNADEVVINGLSVNKTYDFKVVVYDALNNNTESLTDFDASGNPYLKKIVFADTSQPTSSSPPVKFYVCTYEIGSPGCDKTSSADKVNIETDYINRNYSQLAGIVVKYKDHSATGWTSIAGDNMNRQLGNGSATLYLKKGTYDFQVFILTMNGNTFPINYYTGGATATITMPAGAPTTDDLEAPFFENDVVNVSITGKTGAYFVSWTPAVDNIGVDHYDAVITGPSNYSKTLTDIPNPDVTLNDLVSGHTYNFKITAFDAAGNKSVEETRYATAP